MVSDIDLLQKRLLASWSTRGQLPLISRDCLRSWINRHFGMLLLAIYRNTMWPNVFMGVKLGISH